MCHIWLLHSSDGHLDCFHLLPGLNNAAVNIGIQASFVSLFSVLRGAYLEWICRVVWAVTPCLNVWGAATLASRVAAAFYVHVRTREGPGFSTSCNTRHFLGLDRTHRSGCDVGSHCGFDLRFPKNVEHLFMHLLIISVSFRENYLWKSSAYFLVVLSH